MRDAAPIGTLVVDRGVTWRVALVGGRRTWERV